MKRILSLLLAMIFMVMVIPVGATENVVLEETEIIPTLQYADDFSGSTMNQRIVLADAVYSDGAVLGNASATYEKFRVYYNQDQTPVTGNVVTEFTVKQEGMAANGNSIHMHYYTSVSSETGETVDLRWNYDGYYGKLRVQSGTDTTSEREFGNKIRRSVMKIKVKYNTESGALSVWLDDEQVVSENTGFAKNDHKHMGYIKFSANAANIKVILEDFKWYYEPTIGVPASWGEDIYYEDFETDIATPVSNEKITLNSNGSATYKWENGALNINTTGNWIGTKFLLSDEKLTGEYVVDVCLGGTNITGSPYRLNFGDGDIMYLAWTGSNITLQTYGDGTNTSNQKPLDSVSASTYHAEKVLRVTVHYNTVAGTAAIYLNGIHATTIDFATVTSDITDASIMTVALYGYPGTMDVESVRAYRPLKGLQKTVEDGVLKLASETAKDVQLYLATYSGEGASKTLTKVGKKTLSMEKGKIYSIDVNDWDNAKLFLLSDQGLQPLCNSSIVTVSQ